MLIIPAIDLKDGKCVRLSMGKKEHETVFSDNPVQVAEVNPWRLERDCCKPFDVRHSA